MQMLSIWTSLKTLSFGKELKQSHLMESCVHLTLYQTTKFWTGLNSWVCNWHLNSWSDGETRLLQEQKLCGKCWYSTNSPFPLLFLQTFKKSFFPGH